MQAGPLGDMLQLRLERNGQGLQRHPPHCRGVDPDESGANLPIRHGYDALAQDQVCGPEPRCYLRRTHLCSRAKALLFSTYDVHWLDIEASALVIGCLLLVVAYVRTGFAEIDLYPSRTLLRSSLTVFIVGGYLFFVGILANIVRRFGGGESFQLTVSVILLGMAGLGLLLLSDRLRQRVRGFVGLHFARSQHDSVRIWTEFSPTAG